MVTRTRSGLTRKIANTLCWATTAAWISRTIVAAAGTTWRTSWARSSTPSRWTTPSRSTTCTADCRTIRRGVARAARATRLDHPMPTGTAWPVVMASTTCLIRSTTTSPTRNRKTAAWCATTRVPARPKASSHIRKTASGTAGTGARRSCRHSTPAARCTSRRTICSRAPIAATRGPRSAPISRVTSIATACPCAVRSRHVMCWGCTKGPRSSATSPRCPSRRVAPACWPLAPTMGSFRSRRTTARRGQRPPASPASPTPRS